MRTTITIFIAAFALSCTTAFSQVTIYGAQTKVLMNSDITLVVGQGSNSGGVKKRSRKSSGVKKRSRKRRARSRRGGLAGQKGNVNRRGPRGRGNCAKIYKKYIAASGHSAYAQTPRHDQNGVICGWSTGAGSAASAEKGAMRSCNGGRKKFRVGIRGKCEVYASK